MDGPVLIAGCGYVGVRAALELSRIAPKVLGLRRNVDSLPEGIVRVRADLDRPGDLPEVPSLEALVYMASAGERTEAAYRRAYVDGVDRLADALGHRIDTMRRAIFVSSTAVWGDSVDEVDELTDPSPSGFTGSALLEGEARFRARFPGATVLRLAGIYGPGRTRLVRQVASNGPFDSTAETIGNRFHRDDCAGAIVHLLAHPLPEATYIGVDDAPVCLGEVRGFIAQELGLDPTPFLPRGPRTGKRLSNRRLRASGYVLRVPTYREGYPAIVREVREQS